MAYYNVPRKRSIFNFFSTTTKIILLNILVYILLWVVFSIYGEEILVKYFTITPNLILQGETLWTLFTSMFSHQWIFHLFVNMFSLFFIGNFLEKIIGGKRLFWVYILAGLLGGIFFVLAGAIFQDNTPGLGASGAIFGILGVLAVIVPNSRISLITGPLILILLQVLFQQFLPAGFVPVFDLIINILLFVMIFSLFSFNPRTNRIALPLELRMWTLPIVAIVPLVIVGFFVPLPIGNSAHIGGLFAGLAYGFYLRNKYPKKVNNLSRYFS